MVGVKFSTKLFSIALFCLFVYRTFGINFSEKG